MEKNLELYTINNEYTITEILSHFDSDTILGIMYDRLNNYNYSSLPEANVVLAFENNFTIMKQEHPIDSDNINQVRGRVYQDMVNILCNHFNLQCNINEYTDLYSLAYYLYDFLVCNFKNYIIKFYTDYIISSKDSLYKTLNLDSLKKIKESTAIYNKKISLDPKYAVIGSNLELVIDFLSTIDFNLSYLIRKAYSTEPNIMMFLEEILSERSNFFREWYYLSIKRIEIFPVILTDIKLNMTRMLCPADTLAISTYMNRGETDGTQIN